MSKEDGARIGMRVEDVSFSAHAPIRGASVRHILHGISLDLPEPRIAIIGANGSGKSTLAAILAGLISPTSGAVSIGPVGAYLPVGSRRSPYRVGCTFTDPLAQLLMSTPVDDVELSLRATIPSRTRRRAAALELLAARGLAHVSEQSIYDLSGGERQLVALTSVLAAQPSVVVADEPTTLLDMRNAWEVRQAFAALSQQLIVATHDMRLASQMDRAILIHEGRVRADGSPADVIATYEAVMGIREAEACR